MTDSPWLDERPWLAEPDYKTGTHAGLKVLVTRHPSLLHLCGYVAVPPGHPAHRLHYDAVKFDGDYYPHGGLTYAEDHPPSRADKFDEAGDWWFGFDCAHLGDLVPGVRNFGEHSYKTMEFVMGECERLADALAAMKLEA